MSFRSIIFRVVHPNTHVHDVISGDRGPEVTGRGRGPEVDLGYDRKWTLDDRKGTNKGNMETF